MYVTSHVRNNSIHTGSIKKFGVPGKISKKRKELSTTRENYSITKKNQTLTSGHKNFPQEKNVTLMFKKQITMAMRKRPREEEDRKSITMMQVTSQQQDTNHDEKRQKENDRVMNLSNISNNRSQDNMLVSKVSPITKKVTFRVVSPGHSPSILKSTFGSIVKDPIKKHESLSSPAKVASTEDTSDRSSNIYPAKSKDMKTKDDDHSDELLMSFDDTPLLFDEQQKDEDDGFDLLQCFADQWLKSHPTFKTTNDEMKKSDGKII